MGIGSEATCADVRIHVCLIQENGTTKAIPRDAGELRIYLVAPARGTTRCASGGGARESEKHTRHDIMAVVLALTEKCGTETGRYVHLGATSNDISDTATALQLRDAIRVLVEDLGELRGVLWN